MNLRRKLPVANPLLLGVALLAGLVSGAGAAAEPAPVVAATPAPVSAVPTAPAAPAVASAEAAAQTAAQAAAQAAAEASAEATSQAASAEAHAAASAEAREAALRAQEAALRASEEQQKVALAAVEAARQQLEQQVEAEVQRANSELARTEAGRAELRTRDAQQRDAVRRDLQRAHDELRRASRELERVHRELGRSEANAAREFQFRFAEGGRPVIGIVMGETTEAGVRVLGVSPDGPAERAGLAQGDVIVSVMGQSLAAAPGEQQADSRQLLISAMEGIEIGDELAVTVLREGKQQEFLVIPEKREPLAWHNVMRLPATPAAPVAPGAPEAPSSKVQTIEVPEIDHENLRHRVEILQEGAALEALQFQQDKLIRVFPDSGEFELEFEGFSELGDAALAGSDIWMGMALVGGLKLATVEPELGAYFKAERGVLVLQAGADNGLQLKPGDVILDIDGQPVNQPGDVMRTLRELEVGQQLDISIMRERKNRTLEATVPERRLGAWLGGEIELQAAMEAVIGH